MRKDFEIDFVKFSPAPGFKIYADVELGNLMELAPEGAVCTAKVEKAGDGFLCRLVLTDAVEPIYTTVFGDSALAALGKATGVMAEKIRAQKNRRFERVRAIARTRLAVGNA